MRLRALVTAGLSAGLAVVLAGVAWACTAQPSILSVGPMSSAPNTEVTVTGRAVAAGPVEVRWNALDGPMLAKVGADARGDFVTTITVPNARPGVYSIIAVAQNTGVARMAFEVTPSSSGAEEAARAPRPAWAVGPVTPRSSPSSPGLAVGSALLAAGLVTLFAGAATASVQRRRAGVR